VIFLVPPPPLKGKHGNHGARGHCIDMLAKAKVALVETTMDAHHKGLCMYEGYIQCYQDTRDQKYEAQMLDPSHVVKYVAPSMSNNPQALLGVPDKIVPRKGTMLEYKTRGIFNLPVAPTPLLPDPLAEQAIGPTQEKTTAKMPYNGTFMPSLQPTTGKHLGIINQHRVCLPMEHMILHHPLHHSQALRHPIKGCRLVRSTIIIAEIAASAMVTLLLINNGLDTLARLDLDLHLRLAHTISTGTHHTNHGE
jgi:hypothetical protein